MAVKDMPNGSNYSNGNDQKKKPKNVHVKDISFKQKVARAFIADEVTDVKSYALFGVIIPSTKKLIRELIMNAIDMAFYGKRGGDRGRRGDGAYYDYSRRRDEDRDVSSSDFSRQQSRGQQFIGIRDLDRVTFDTQDDAADTLSYLFSAIDEFGVASVGDFLSYAGLQTNPIHSKWGWFDLKDSAVVELPDGGWAVDLPKPKSI